MAPELLDGKEYGPECDIWSIGAVFYQWLVGRYPYQAKNEF
jgi:serine/threonine protein kinase